MPTPQNGFTDWRLIDQQILAELNIESEYRAAGLRTSGQPNQSGWLSCHCIGREDRNPSAAIYVGDGPLRGRYKDHSSGESLSMWDASARLSGKTWREARADLASRTSVVVAADEAKRPHEQFRFNSLSPSTPYLYARRKPGVTAESIVQCGGVYAEWPEWMKKEERQILIAFPCWSPQLRDADATGYHCVESTGGLVKIWKGKGKKPIESKTMQKGATGILNTWSVDHWHEAETIWITEGLSDMLAMQSLMGNRTDHLVISFGGAGKSQSVEPFRDLFADKNVNIVFDSDPPTPDFPTGAGHAGSVKLIDVLIGNCKEIRNIRLQ